MSTSTPTERDQQSFAETALRLGGKTEEEARRTGALDKADEQVESLFKEKYQTANSPVHKAVWDAKVPLDLFAPPPLAPSHPSDQDDGGVAGRGATTPRGRHAAGREGQDLADRAARAGRRRLLGPAHRPEVRRVRAPVRALHPLPDAHGDVRRHDRRPGVHPRLHRRRGPRAHLRHAGAKGALSSEIGQRPGPVRLRPDRAGGWVRPDRPAHHGRPRRRRLRPQRREAVHHQRRPRPDGRRRGADRRQAGRAGGRSAAGGERAFPRQDLRFVRLAAGLQQRPDFQGLPRPEGQPAEAAGRRRPDDRLPRPEPRPAVAVRRGGRQHAGDAGQPAAVGRVPPHLRPADRPPRAGQAAHRSAGRPDRRRRRPRRHGVRG